MRPTRFPTANTLFGSKPWLLVVSALTGLLLALGPREPDIHGRTPRQWAHFYILRPTEFKDAPVEVRPVVVPFLIHELERKPFPRRPLFAVYEWLHEHAPDCIVEWLPPMLEPGERRLRAIVLLGDLGPLGDKAVPALIPLLSSDTLQCSTALTLAAIGPSAAPAVPPLLDLVWNDPAPYLATSLARLAPHDPEVIQTLAELSRIGPAAVRIEAKAALRICAQSINVSLELLRMESPESLTVIRARPNDEGTMNEAGIVILPNPARELMEPIGDFEVTRTAGF